MLVGSTVISEMGGGLESWGVWEQRRMMQGHILSLFSHNDVGVSVQEGRNMKGKNAMAYGSWVN